jgi:hypothetical protein
LSVTSDSARGFPIVGQYLESETGLDFVRTVFLNFGLEFDPEYSLFYEDANGLNQILWRTQTLRERDVHDGMSFSFVRVVSAPPAPLSDSGTATALMLDPTEFEWGAPVLASPPIFAGRYTPEQKGVFLAVMEPYDEATFFAWVDVLMRVQHAVFPHFVGYLIPHEGLKTPATVVSSALFGDVARLSDVLVGDLTPTQRYKIVIGVADGMRYLHSIGVYHRALSMDAILLDGSRHPKIIGLERAMCPGHDLEGSVTADAVNRARAEDVFAFGNLIAALFGERDGRDLPANLKAAWLNLSSDCRAENQDRRPSFAVIVKTLHGAKFRTQVDCSDSDLYLSVTTRYGSYSNFPVRSQSVGPGVAASRIAEPDGAHVPGWDTSLSAFASTSRPT